MSEKDGNKETYEILPDSASSSGAQTPTNHTIPTEPEDPTSLDDVSDPRESLGDFDWAELEARFCAKMEECSKAEEEIGNEFREWIEVFTAWASTTLDHEGDRAHKRLRTRMAWVQGAEKSLEEKRQHYIKVVQAFESALALLGGL